MPSTEKILVTGHLGFVGSALCKTLSKRDRHLWVGISSRTGNNLERFGELDPLEPVEMIVHLAGLKNVPSSWKYPADYYRTNFLTTLNVLEKARQWKTKVIFLSSYIYGTPLYYPVDETHPLDCNNPYARSKRQAEQLCEAYATDFDVPVTILRLFNLYGPGQSDEHIIPHIINQASTGDRIIVNDLAPKRDYLWIDDLVEAIIYTIEGPCDGFEVFNLGFGESFSVGEIIDLVIAHTGKKEIITRERIRKNEIPDCICDNQKFRATFDWKPHTNLADGISSLIQTCHAG